MMMDKQSRSIAEQAAEYLVRRPVETPSQRLGREAWLAEKPEHAREYETMRRLWDGMGSLRDDPELQALKAADLAALGRPRWVRFQGVLAVAATILALIGAASVALVYLSRAPEMMELHYATELGERRTEMLADGTQVVLNTVTALEVGYSRRSREIRLVRGEAQFDVAYDAARPFVVRVGESTVTALGTRFQVRSDTEAATVTLLDGKVEVAHGEARIALLPNHQARLAAGDGIVVRAVDPELADGWLNGWLRFRDAPLSQVVAEANRYSDRQLRLGDPALAGMGLSGNFHAGDSASIATAIELLLPVRVDDSGAEIVLLPQ